MSDLDHICVKEKTELIWLYSIITIYFHKIGIFQENTLVKHKIELMSSETQHNHSNIYVCVYIMANLKNLFKIATINYIRFCFCL